MEEVGADDPCSLAGVPLHWSAFAIAAFLEISANIQQRINIPGLKQSRGGHYQALFSPY